MSGYTHSVVFAHVKKHKEQLSGNLTTAQYLGILDKMLHSAVSPWVDLNSNFEAFVVQVLGWQERNFKRRVSFLDRAAFRDKAMEFLSGSCKWTDLKLDRLLLFQFVQLQIDAHRPTFRFLNSSPSATVGNGDVDVALCSSPERVRQFLLCYRSSSYWIAEATLFREKVLEKYFRLCLVTARRDYTGHFRTTIPLDEIVQAYIEAACRAVDRCDPDQGVLTTIVQYWLMSARNSLSKHMKTQNESSDQFSIDRASLEAHSVQEDATDNPQESARIRDLLALVDTDGLARAYLGIEESVPNLLRRYNHA